MVERPTVNDSSIQFARAVLRLPAVPKLNPPGYPSAPDADWLLGLLNVLQTTLDTQQLITLFAKHSRAVVAHDGVAYRNTRADLDFWVGMQQPHSCCFELTLVESALGEFSFTRDKAFSNEEIEDLKGVLAHLLLPLRNCLLHKQALGAAAMDPLTGIFNRSTLRGVVERDILLARRYGTPLSLLMLDLDWFKKLNDTYGHIAGDLALRKLAQGLRDCVRHSDPIFRYGGEEFALVLSNTDTSGAATLAERVRQRVEQLHTDYDGQTLRITASIGIASLDENDDFESLLAKADRALYRAKANGRNCVAVGD